VKIRLQHSSYIIDFLDRHFSSNDISNILEDEFSTAISHMGGHYFSDWEIQFKVIYDEGTSIEIFRSHRGYKNDKQKVVFIHIPIPEKSIVDWGVSDTQFIKRVLPPNRNDILPVDFSKHLTLQGYLLDSVRRSITFALNRGFKVNGIHVQTQEHNSAS
jgi:hypothetical protein